jgi:hypothetical protein
MARFCRLAAAPCGRLPPDDGNVIRWSAPWRNPLPKVPTPPRPAGGDVSCPRHRACLARGAGLFARSDSMVFPSGPRGWSRSLRRAAWALLMVGSAWAQEDADGTMLSFEEAWQRVQDRSPVLKAASLAQAAAQGGFAKARLTPTPSCRSRWKTPAPPRERPPCCSVSPSNWADNAPPVRPRPRPPWRCRRPPPNPGVMNSVPRPCWPITRCRWPRNGCG